MKSNVAFISLGIGEKVVECAVRSILINTKDIIESVSLNECVRYV